MVVALRGEDTRRRRACYAFAVYCLLFVLVLLVLFIYADDHTFEK